MHDGIVQLFFAAILQNGNYQKLDVLQKIVCSDDSCLCYKYVNIVVFSYTVSANRCNYRQKTRLFLSKHASVYGIYADEKSLNKR